MCSSPPRAATSPTEMATRARLELFQLMENAFLESAVDESWTHPDNRGWMTLFADVGEEPDIPRRVAAVVPDVRQSGSATSAISASALPDPDAAIRDLEPGASRSRKRRSEGVRRY